MSLKLSLDDSASGALNSMLKQIKQESPDCALSHSALASWILVHFSEAGFEKAKPNIAKNFFNAKAYLRRKLKELDSPEKIEAALSEVQSKLKVTKGKPERKANGESGATST